MRVLQPRRAVEGPRPELEFDPGWTVRILHRFIAEEVRRTGRKRVVLGLSGGIDSALAAWLAAGALGAENTHCVTMPFRTSSPSAAEDARAVVDRLGLPAELVDISPIVDGFLGTTGEVDRLRLGNVMARARMLVLFDRSAALDALVLGTSNKTELLLGYGTLHGDMASALNPLGDLYKTQVRELSRHLGVPREILEKPPSADLWPDQSDEEELGFRYEEVDRLLALHVDKRLPREAIVAAGFAPELVDRVIRQVIRSQFKRRQPVIAKLSRRTIGLDFRYPRDWMT